MTAHALVNIFLASSTLDSLARLSLRLNSGLIGSDHHESRLPLNEWLLWDLRTVVLNDVRLGIFFRALDRFGVEFKIWLETVLFVVKLIVARWCIHRSKVVASFVRHVALHHCCIYRWLLWHFWHFLTFLQLQLLIFWHYYLIWTIIMARIKNTILVAVKFTIWYATKRCWIYYFKLPIYFKKTF